MPSSVFNPPCIIYLQANNVAELLLVRGLAQVVRHRGDEERSGEPQQTCRGWAGSQRARPRFPASKDAWFVAPGMRLCGH